MSEIALASRLAEHTVRLAELTERIGDAVSTQVLRQLEPRLRQGLVRVAVVGVTGSGKSTMVNMPWCSGWCCRKIPVFPLPFPCGWATIPAPMPSPGSTGPRTAK